MYIESIINDYIENFDFEDGIFNDFLIMSDNYRNSQEFNNFNPSTPIKYDSELTNVLPF